ncbi:MAG: metallophosphoesterase [Peptoniphilaceae bacterium]|nr:metallophosphoesterase [Peptoniphilaceae bacterium]MDY6085913.1 metallophosphoesterase [Peptoniphilaceae bacterium]
MKQHESQTRRVKLSTRLPWKTMRHIGLFLIALLLLLSFYRSNMIFKTTTYTVESPFLSNAFNGYRIAQISDLHGHVFGDAGEDLLTALDAASPNLVVITGDAISRSEKHPEETAKVLQAVASRYPTYYIRGNHELHRDEVEPEQSRFYDALREAGVIVLENESVPILYREAQINLVGLKEPLDAYETNTPPDVKALLGEKPDGFTILLAHNPLWLERYVDWGADLVISGHVHGGMVRLPFVGGVFSPDVSFFPRYDRGVYQMGQTKMVVSTGMGGSGFPFRLFNDQELVVITLSSQSIH